MLKIIFTLIVSLFFLQGCNTINPPGKNALKNSDDKVAQLETLLENIRLPEGFKIEIFASNVTNARSLCWSDEGTLYVGTRDEGKVYALKDTDGDFKADQQYVLVEGLSMPNGVALQNGHLYIAEVDKILRLKNIETQLANPPKPEVVFDQYPSKKHHGWKYIAFGPDGKLYVPVGAPCNICESKDEIFNTITRINPDGTGFEIVQRGIRNTVGFDWHPQTNELWFTDNGRDWMGDDQPACELNHAPADKLHFGYPYCHQGDLPDPKLGDDQHPCSDYVAPAVKLGPHVAPLGMEFYTGSQFPSTYSNQILIAEHGSWNRSKKLGYRIMIVTLENNKASSYEPFAEGWLDETTDEAWGRPVDIEFLPDGSMLVSDDFADAIYRISFSSGQ